MSEDARFYGHLSTGEAVYEYTLSSPSGVVVKALNYGGIITEFSTPLARGGRLNTVLALKTLKDYELNPSYVGVLVGRYGGRLASPVKSFEPPLLLSENDRGNCLHGGGSGFGKKLYSVQFASEVNSETLHLKYMSPDGEDGFPGNLMVHISYRLWTDGQFQIIYRAISDKDSPLALTHHHYFNLSLDGKNVLSHGLKLGVKALQRTGENQIPTPQRISLVDHPITLDQGMSVAKMNEWILENLKDDKGLDYPFDQVEGSVHQLWCEASGLRLNVLTDCPSVVVYSGGWLNEDLPTVNNRGAMAYGGICFETQEVPNGPNDLENTSGILKKGELYHRMTTFYYDHI